MRILLVEDEIKLNKYIRKNLEEQGFMVDVCFDGLEARNFIETNYENIDLIILDIMLPGLGGLEVMHDIRELNIMTPILLLTAKDQMEDRVVGLNGGADDYLTKPFFLDELTARVKALLRRPKIIVSEEIKIKELTLNLKKGKVAIGKNDIDLTLKEYRIVELLARNQGHIIERDAILDKLWDAGYDSFSNTVDVHIKNLRKKLGAYGKLIETVRGVGYRFSDKIFT